MTDSQTDKFKFFEGKRIQILTKTKLRYGTSNLQVLGDSLVFTDKFGMRVMIDCSDVLRIEELANGY